MNNTAVKLNEDFQQLIKQLNNSTAITIAHTHDPELRAVLDVIHNLGDKISTFYMRIQQILKLKQKNRSIEFIFQYFFKNFSRISENTKASKHIISYVLKNLNWLKEHSSRIIESLKLLYSDLLTIQIDCEELYKKIYNTPLCFDFGLDFKTEQKALQELMSPRKAYVILGLQEGATREEVKHCFRNLAKKLHPDLNPGADREEFIRVKTAYKKVLSRLN